MKKTIFLNNNFKYLLKSDYIKFYRNDINFITIRKKKRARPAYYEIQTQYMARYRGDRWRDLGIADGELQNQQISRFKNSRCRITELADDKIWKHR